MHPTGVYRQINMAELEKEIAELKGDLKKFTTKNTIKALKDKYEENK